MRSDAKPGSGRLDCRAGGKDRQVHLVWMTKRRTSTITGAPASNVLQWVYFQVRGGLVRILIVSDIHSNLEAFQSVVDHASSRGGFLQIWQLGDLVGYGPDPAGCIDLLREYDHIGVAGNHDLAAVGRLGLERFNAYAAAAVRWTTSQLSDDQVDYLRKLPLRMEAHDFMAVHGSPRDPIWEYLLSKATAMVNFGYFSTKRCLVGHSHVQFLCKLNDGQVEFFEFPLDLPIALGEDRCIINPGSVGQPRDGVPTASYSLYDSDDDTITYHRVLYDFKLTQQKMSDHGLPRYLIHRLAKGL